MTAAVDVEALVAAVPDPELPFLTIADLGILRSVTVEGTAVRVTVTPTYSGCPALDSIREDVAAVLRDSGFAEVTVETVLTPAWTTDWLSDDARAALAEHGIAPPGPARGPVLLPVPHADRRPATPIGVVRPGWEDPGGIHGDEPPTAPACPRCGTRDTEEVARFGSTACKALWRCRSCREPFEHLKAH